MKKEINIFHYYKIIIYRYEKKAYSFFFITGQININLIDIANEKKII